MKALFLIVGFISFSFVSCQEATKKEEVKKENKYDMFVNIDYKKALELAIEKDKPVFFLFYRICLY